MILDLISKEGENSLIHIVTNRPNKARTKAIKDYAEKLTMHNTGLYLSKYIERMDYFEKPQLADLRKKYSPSNEDVTGRLHRPLDKVFSARGGSILYNMPESNRKEFEAYLQDLKDGYSIRAWIKTFWFIPMNYDPMGVILMEISKDGSKIYPTYKASQYIFDYPKTNGRKLPYLILDLTKEKEEQNKLYSGTTSVDNITTDIMPTKSKILRVIDDAFDRLVKVDKDKVVVLEEYANAWGEVPAITLGWDYDQVKEMYVSPDDKIIDLLDQMLRLRSTMTMFRMHHGFPLKWQYASDCPTCAGTGKLTGDNCPSCSGTGTKSKYDVAETIVIPVPKDKLDPIVAPNLAGYVTPPIETWQQMIEDIKQMYADMHFARWGTHQIEDSSQETATGRFIDVQPVNDALFHISNAAEYVEKWITDMIGNLKYPTAYKGASIQYGKRYLIEPPEAVWMRYVDARTKGATVASLNNLYIQYLQSEYEANETELFKQMKLFYVEPFVHININQVRTLTPKIEDYYKKLYFSDWVNSLKGNDLLVMDVEQLKNSLTEYILSLQIDNQTNIYGQTTNDTKAANANSKPASS